MRHVICQAITSSLAVPLDERQMAPGPGRDRISEGAPT
jgi:hypothetical protein